MNAILKTMRIGIHGKHIALMQYGNGAAFLVNKYGIVLRPRKERGLDPAQVQAAIASGELTECSTPLAQELRGRGVGTWRVM